MAEEEDHDIEGLGIDGLDMEDILGGNFDGLPDRHTNFEVHGEMTAKGVVFCLPDIIKRMNGVQLEAFTRSPFGQFVDVPEPHGDPLIMHKMMHHEVRGDPQLAVLKRFRFEVFGHRLEYGEPEFILITGFRTGRYVDLLGEKSHTNKSSFRKRVFPDATDSSLRLRDLEQLTKNRRFREISVEDAVLVAQIILLLRGCMGRDGCTGIPAEVLKLADDPNMWKSFAWGTYLWRYTYYQMRNIFKKLYNYVQDYVETGAEKELKYTVVGFMYPFKIWIWETFPIVGKKNYALYSGEEVIPRMRAWTKSMRLEWTQIRDIFNVSREENLPRVMVPRPLELATAYFSRYLRTQDPNFLPTPPLQQSPPNRSPVRKKCRSDVCSSEAAKSTSSSSFQENRGQAAEEGTKVVLKKLVNEITKMSTEIVFIKEKIQSFDRVQRNEEFGVEHMDNMEVNSQFFNVSMPEPTPIISPRTYEPPPIPVVNLQQATPDGPRYPRRERNPSYFFRSPNVQMDSTTRVKKNKKKNQKKASSDPLEAQDTINDEVPNHRQFNKLMEVYVHADCTEFFSLLSRGVVKLKATHRFYNREWDREFWDRLLGVIHAGWLVSWHIDIWSLLMTERRPVDARWRVMPTTLMRADWDDDWSNLCAGRGCGRIAGVEGPPWWTLDRLLIPVNINNNHWILAEVDFRAWQVTIYDSLTGSFKLWQNEGRFLKFGKNILDILDKTYYWDHLPNEPRRTSIMKFVEAQNVPQQYRGDGALGDCGIFVCMFMELLASGLPIQLEHEDSIDAGRSFRYRMAQIFWNSR